MAICILVDTGLLGAIPFTIQTEGLSIMTSVIQVTLDLSIPVAIGCAAVMGRVM